MPSASPRLLTSAIPAVISGAVVWQALRSNAWAEWGVGAMAPTTPSATSFADLANITSTAQCLTDGTDYTICDPYGRPFQPYVVLPARILSTLGLGPADTGALGTLLAVAYVATVAALGWHLARAWRAGTPWLVVSEFLLAVAAISAPAMLAIERGQIEILTLALAVAALLALSRDRLAYSVGGAVAGVLAVVSKFFAIGLFAPFVRRGRPNWAALAGLAVSLVFLALSWSDLQQAGTAARADQPATSKSMFGAMTLVATLLTDDPVGYVPSASVSEDWTRVRLMGWIVFAVALVVGALVVPRSSLESLDVPPAARALVIGGAGVLAVPYVLGASHDYRMVFLLPVLVGSLLWLSATRGRSSWVPAVVMAGSVLSLVTGAAMVSTSSGFIWGKPAMVVGDIALLITLALCGGSWIRGLVSRDR